MQDNINILKGSARRLKLNDDINTDYVISGRYKFKIQNMTELAKYIFEDIDPGFASKIQNGDFIIAGENFGCGSSREQAPAALKAAGISAVIAKSYARIFYRNAFNLGLPLLECDTDQIMEGDDLVLDINKDELANKTKGSVIKIKPLSGVMKVLLNDGGVIEHFKKHGGFKFET